MSFILLVSLTYAVRASFKNVNKWTLIVYYVLSVATLPMIPLTVIMRHGSWWARQCWDHTGPSPRTILYAALRMQLKCSLSNRQLSEIIVILSECVEIGNTIELTLSYEPNKI